MDSVEVRKPFSPTSHLGMHRSYFEDTPGNRSSGGGILSPDCYHCTYSSYSKGWGRRS
ncbi:hypothetical protein BVRB_6g132680 [Beta vulgaris subsp. vulgaris]|nr:hypothetical protein BVRB_6g132680 [Beta vulgaris subsp. vulgaris]